jgi:carbamoyltransferase
MIKWGTTFGSHDGALAVFVDDELVFASDAERWSRKKNDPIIPDRLIEFAENKWGVPEIVYFYEDLNLKNERRKFAGQKPLDDLNFKYPIKYCNHHKSHARYGYYTSPFDDCTVLVIDAIGEWDTLTQWKVTDGNFEQVNNWRYPRSLGLFYSAMTQAAGWKPNEEEYILMGASAVHWSHNKNYAHYQYIKSMWDDDENFHKGIDIEGITDKFEIAAIAQDIYEGALRRIIHHIDDENLVFVGGCALNVSANRHLSKYNTFIPCNPGDGGSAIGCALDHKIESNPYLGYEIAGKYSVTEIIKELKEAGIVGVAKGKAEFGPRALGNRSLLADPSVLDMKDKVNKVKGREEFRPFAPMILKEDVNSYFEEGIPSPFMNTIRKAKKETLDKYPCIVHLDGTSRVQEVTEEPHRTLLEEWKKETGCPMLLNTSLNIKGEPIVNTEKDAQNFEYKTRVKVV